MDKLQQLINIAKSKLQIDDEIWRGEILPRFGGKPDASGRVSLKSLSRRKQTELLRELENKGFQNTAKNEDWRRPRLQKIRAMWGVMAEAGIVRHAGALGVWAKTVVGVDKLEWASAAQLDAVIEGLKSWAGREGFGIRYLPEHRHTEIYRTDAEPSG